MSNQKLTPVKQDIINSCLTRGGYSGDRPTFNPNVKAIKGDAIFLDKSAGSVEEASTTCKNLGLGTMAKKQYETNWKDSWKDVNPQQMQTCDIGDAWWSGDEPHYHPTPGTFIPPHTSEPTCGWFECSKDAQWERITPTKTQLPIVCRANPIRCPTQEEMFRGQINNKCIVKGTRGNAIFLNKKVNNKQDAKDACTAAGFSPIKRTDYEDYVDSHLKNCPSKSETCNIGKTWWSGDDPQKSDSLPGPVYFIPNDLPTDVCGSGAKCQKSQKAGSWLGGSSIIGCQDTNGMQIANYHTKGMKGKAVCSWGDVGPNKTDPILLETTKRTFATGGAANEHCKLTHKTVKTGKPAVAGKLATIADAENFVNQTGEDLYVCSDSWWSSDDRTNAVWGYFNKTSKKMKHPVACLNPNAPTYIPYCPVKGNTCTSPPPDPNADPRWYEQPPETRIESEMNGFIHQIKSLNDSVVKGKLPNQKSSQWKTSLKNTKQSYKKLMNRWQKWLLDNSNPTFTAYTYWLHKKITIDWGLSTLALKICNQYGLIDLWQHMSPKDHNLNCIDKLLDLGVCTNNYPFPNKDKTICYNNPDFAINDIATNYGALDHDDDLRRGGGGGEDAIFSVDPTKGTCNDWCYVNTDPGCKNDSTVRTLKCSNDSKIAETCEKLSGYNYQGYGDNNRTICYNNPFCSKYGILDLVSDSEKGGERRGGLLPRIPPNLRQGWERMPPIRPALRPDGEFPWNMSPAEILYFNAIQAIGRYCTDTIFGPEGMKQVGAQWEGFANACKSWAQTGWDATSKAMQNVMNAYNRLDSKDTHREEKCDCDSWCYTEHTPSFQHTCGKKDAYSCSNMKLKKEEINQSL